MRQVLFTLMVVLFSASAASAYVVEKRDGGLNQETLTMLLKKDMDVNAFSNMSVDDFLKVTPKKYQQMTGKKMGIKQVLALKVAQKQMKNQFSAASNLSKGVYILLAIIGWGFLGIGLLTDFKGNEWWICLLLTALCWLPGVIYALIKMKNYY